MHEMLTVVTNVRGVCLSVSLSVTRLKSAMAHAVYAVCTGSFSAAFTKCLWPLAECGVSLKISNVAVFK